MMIVCVEVFLLCMFVCGGWDEFIDDVEDICLYVLFSVYFVFFIVNKMLMIK